MAARPPRVGLRDACLRIVLRSRSPCPRPRLTRCRWRVNHKLANDFAAVAHSYAVANQVEVLMNRVTDGETGERGFLITGRDEYLGPYHLFTPRQRHKRWKLRFANCKYPMRNPQYWGRAQVRALQL